MRRSKSAKSGSHEGSGIARCLLRGSIGGIMIAHGVRHGRTLDGTARWFESIGFRQPKLQAQLSSVVEVGSGAGVVLGAATPLSASAVVGILSVAYRSVHKPNGFFIASEGWEYVAFLSAASVALSALGPGRFSVDRLLGLDRAASPLARAALTAGLGVGGAMAQIKAFYQEPTPAES